MGCLKITYFNYELKNYLSNILAVVTDRKLVKSYVNSAFDGVESDVVSYLNYYPFGMLMPNRHGGDFYRYSFNGMEKDDEVKGKGYSYDYGFRKYDNRLGKFLSIDPLGKSYPWLTPYQFASNSPIVASDIDGLEANVEIVPNNNSDKPILEIVTYIQIDNQSDLTNDIVNNYAAGAILKMEDVMVGTITIKGVEFDVKSIFYLTDGDKTFSLTFKENGKEYPKEYGVLGEADKIGNTQKNNSDIYVDEDTDSNKEEMYETTAHEKLHELGLKHYDKEDNIMNTYADDSKKQSQMTAKQLKKVVKKILNQQKDKTEKNKVKDYIKNNK